MPLIPAVDADLPALAILINAAYAGGDAAAYLDGDRTSPAALRSELAANPSAILYRYTTSAITSDSKGKDTKEEGHLRREEVPAGCVWVEPDSGSGRAETWSFSMLSVNPASQGSGIGKTILREAEDAVRAKGATRMRMTVVSRRHQLIAWYQRHGYNLTGEKEAYSAEDETLGAPSSDNLEFVVLEKVLVS